MKTINCIILNVFLFLISPTIILCGDDDPVDQAEFHIDNKSTTQDIFVIVRPVGFIFNGQATSNNTVRDYRYSPEAFNDFAGNENNFIPPVVGVVTNNNYICIN